MQKSIAPVVIIAAMSRQNRVIGKNNELLWQLPADLKRFKTLTLGKPVIMGRKTFESILEILGKPLPNRTSIVLTRDVNYDAKGGLTATSFEAALALANDLKPEEIVIGGGAEIYRQALPYTDRLKLTLVDDEPVGDAFFPEFENDFVMTHQEPPLTENSISYQWVDYERLSSADDGNHRS